MDRYELDYKAERGDDEVEIKVVMVTAQRGEWCKWDDVENEIDELNGTIEELKAALDAARSE